MEFLPLHHTRRSLLLYISSKDCLKYLKQLRKKNWVYYCSQFLFIIIFLFLFTLFYSIHWIHLSYARDASWDRRKVVHFLGFEWILRICKCNFVLIIASVVVNCKGGKQGFHLGRRLRKFKIYKKAQKLFNWHKI